MGLLDERRHARAARPVGGRTTVGKYDERRHREWRERREWCERREWRERCREQRRNERQGFDDSELALWWAEQAHARGLSIGQKNAASIEPSFDWALTGSFDAACAAWQPRRYSPILKNRELDAEITRCP